MANGRRAVAGAGLGLGLTALSGGALNPLTLGGLGNLARIGLPALSQFLGGRRQDKAQEDFAKQQKVSNLINALGAAGGRSFGHTPSAEIPKAGMLERLSGAVGTALSAADALRDANDARRLLKGQIKKQEDLAADRIKLKDDVSFLPGPIGKNTLEAADEAALGKAIGQVHGKKSLDAPIGMIEESISWGPGLGGKERTRPFETTLGGAAASLGGISPHFQGALIEQTALDPNVISRLQKTAEDIGFNLASDLTISEDAADELARVKLGRLSDDPDVVESLIETVRGSRARTIQGQSENRNKIYIAAIQAGIEEARLSGPEAGYGVFMANLGPGFKLSEGEAGEFLKMTLEAVAAPVDLSAEQTKFLSSIMALDTSLARIQDKIRENPKVLEKIGPVEGWVTRLKAAFNSGSTLDSETIEFLTNLGFTSEMAVRIFSGAAIRTEEEERFRRDFIGLMSQPPENLLARTKAFRDGLRDRRDEAWRFVGVGETGRLFEGYTNAQLAKMASAGDRAAETELARRLGRIE